MAHQVNTAINSLVLVLIVIALGELLEIQISQCNKYNQIFLIIYLKANFIWLLLMHVRVSIQALMPFVVTS